MTNIHAVTGSLLLVFFAVNALRMWEYMKQIQRHLQDNYLNLSMPLWSTSIIGASNIMNAYCAFWRSGGFNEVVFFLLMNFVACSILLAIVARAHWLHRGKPKPTAIADASKCVESKQSMDSPTGLNQWHF